MLAVEANYETGIAIVGTEPGAAVASSEIQAALEDIGYGGEFLDERVLE